MCALPPTPLSLFDTRAAGRPRARATGGDAARRLPRGGGGGSGGGGATPPSGFTTAPPSVFVCSAGTYAVVRPPIVVHMTGWPRILVPGFWSHRTWNNQSLGYRLASASTATAVSHTLLTAPVTAAAWAGDRSHARASGCTRAASSTSSATQLPMPASRAWSNRADLMGRRPPRVIRVVGKESGRSRASGPRPASNSSTSINLTLPNRRASANATAVTSLLSLASGTRSSSSLVKRGGHVSTSPVSVLTYAMRGSPRTAMNPVKPKWMASTGYAVEGADLRGGHIAFPSSSHNCLPWRHTRSTRGVRVSLFSRWSDRESMGSTGTLTWASMYCLKISVGCLGWGFGR